MLRLILLMALNAVADMIVNRYLTNGSMRIMAGRALQFALGLQITLRPQKPNRLKPSEQVWVFTQLLFSHVLG